MTLSQHKDFPHNVGIVAIDIYFPQRYILQQDLERHDNVSAGKYTIGLGQQQMAFCDDCEDINSMCLTAVQNLMEKFNISYTSIGRMEIGTETLVDKSKSVKTHLMDLFVNHGNTNIEGIATTNACYGGTSALFNAVQWIESSYWDGRYAIVVAGDIAIYAQGNARPTSGAGVVAMLIGPNASIVMERQLRGTYMENAYDFYKPNLSSEYPEVDGPLSLECYMRAIDQCYNQYCPKLESIIHSPVKLSRDIDYVVLHSPYAKIVQKAFARLFLNDYLRHDTINNTNNDDEKSKLAFSSIKDLLNQKLFDDKLVEKVAIQASNAYYMTRTDPSLLTTRMIGNMYCGSLYGSLLSLLSVTPENQLLDKRILMFSYGSGLAASMFSFKVIGSVQDIVDKVNLQTRLNTRTMCMPVAFEAAMQLREHSHNAVEYSPQGDVNHGLPNGAYYLANVDARYRRTYVRKQ